MKFSLSSWAEDQQHEEIILPKLSSHQMAGKLINFNFSQNDPSGEISDFSSASAQEILHDIDESPFLMTDRKKNQQIAIAGQCKEMDGREAAEPSKWKN